MLQKKPQTFSLYKFHVVKTVLLQLTDTRFPNKNRNSNKPKKNVSNKIMGLNRLINNQGYVTKLKYKIGK